MKQGEPAAWRAEFNAEVEFSNGGRLQAQGFRLDIPTDTIEDAELGARFIRHLGLLMVGSVQIRNKRLVHEAHKGSRGMAVSRTRIEGSTGAHHVVDLSHTIEHGMITYPGLPGPEIGEFLTREASRRHYAPGTEFSIGQITMVANTGTYLDSPYHRFADGIDLGQLLLASAVDLPGIVARVTGAAGRAVDQQVLLPHEVNGRAVLIHTGWDQYWGTEAYDSGHHPFLTRDAAEWLVAQGAALVGIDSLNVDNTEDGERPAHTLLLASGVPIVEHLTGLEHLPPEAFRFHAAPSAVVGLGTWPVRAYAIVDGEG